MFSWLRPYVVDDGFLKPGNEKVCAFIGDLFSDAGKTIEDDGSGATFYIVQRALC